MTVKAEGATSASGSASLRGARNGTTKKTTSAARAAVLARDEALSKLSEDTEREAAAIAEEAAADKERAEKLIAELNEINRREELRAARAKRNSQAYAFQVYLHNRRFGSEDKGPKRSYPVNLPHDTLIEVRKVAVNSDTTIQEVLRVGAELAVAYFKRYGTK